MRGAHPEARSVPGTVLGGSACMAPVLCALQQQHASDQFCSKSIWPTALRGFQAAVGVRLVAERHREGSCRPSTLLTPSATRTLPDQPRGDGRHRPRACNRPGLPLSAIVRLQRGAVMLRHVPAVQWRGCAGLPAAAAAARRRRRRQRSGHATQRHGDVSRRTCARRASHRRYAVLLLRSSSRACAQVRPKLGPATMLLPPCGCRAACMQAWRPAPACPPALQLTAGRAQRWRLPAGGDGPC